MYEYKTVSVVRGRIEEAIETWAEKGWELVSVAWDPRLGDDASVDTLHIFLKHAK